MPRAGMCIVRYLYVGANLPNEAENLEETQPSPVIHFKNVPKFTSKVGGKFVSL